MGYVPPTVIMDGPHINSENLLQYSKKIRTFSEDLHGPTTTICNLRLPITLLCTYWKRHDLSIADAYQCINYVPAQFIWMLALLYGQDLSPSSLKPSFANETDVLVSSKAIAVKKIIRIITHKFSHIDKIFADPSSQHIPAIPTHYISRALYDVAASALSPVLDIHTTNVVHGFISYVGVLWLPRLFEGASISCTRVIRKPPCGRYTTECLAKRGYVVRERNTLDEFVCTEEYIFVTLE